VITTSAQTYHLYTSPNIPEHVSVNYAKTFMYDDAHVNVLEEALTFQMDHISKGIGRKKKGIQNAEIMILWI
jgi:hypothetical protein